MAHRMLASNMQFVKWILREKSNIDSGQFKPMQIATIAALSESPGMVCADEQTVCRAPGDSRKDYGFAQLYVR